MPPIKCLLAETLFLGTPHPSGFFKLYITVVTLLQDTAVLEFDFDFVYYV